MTEEQNYYAIQELQEIVSRLHKQMRETENIIFNLRKEILEIQIRLELDKK